MHTFDPCERCKLCPCPVCMRVAAPRPAMLPALHGTPKTRLALHAKVTAGVESHSALPETQLTLSTSTMCNEIDPETRVVSDGTDSENLNGSSCERGGLLLPQAKVESQLQPPVQRAGSGGSYVMCVGKKM